MRVSHKLSNMGGNQSNQNQVSKSLAESAELHKHVQTGNMTEVEKILLTASMEVVNGQENEVISLTSYSCEHHVSYSCFLFSRIETQP